MGGVGSGRTIRFQSRTTIEQTKQLDIRSLARKGLLKTGTRGSVSWKINDKESGGISFVSLPENLTLMFQYRKNDGKWQSLEQTIYIDKTPCNYGGERSWFLCPNCQKRVAILYLGGRHFFCRGCYRLPYRSQNETRVDRLMSKKHKLGNRIFEHYEHGEGWGKKKGMHQKTFNRLHIQYLALERKWLSSVAGYFGFDQ